MIGFSSILFIIGFIIIGFGFLLLYKNKDKREKRKAKFYILIGLITALSPFLLIVIYNLIGRY